LHRVGLIAHDRVVGSVLTLATFPIRIQLR
jgi:hypothetical protein